MSDTTFVYDKAKYHFETIEHLGLPEEHCYNHTTFFMSWLVRKRLMSDWFEQECQPEVARYRAGTFSINELYELLRSFLSRTDAARGSSPNRDV